MRPGTSAPKTLKNEFRAKAQLNPWIELALLVFSSLLFVLSFPNEISVWGFGPLGFFVLIPLIVVLNTTTWPRVFLYGFLSGLISYTLFNYWLAVYHPVAIFVVPIIYAFYYLILAPALRLVHQAFGSWGWLGQILIWTGYEFARTLGFLGYSYGILGYTQYLFTQLSGVASLTGVWGLTALVVAPSFFFADAVGKSLVSVKSNAQLKSHLLRTIGTTIAKSWRPMLVYAGIFILALIYSAASLRPYDESKRIRMALVQQNVDPWVGGMSAYRESVTRLTRQSEAALKQDPGIELVVWAETSLVPAIEYHLRYREEPEKYQLIVELKKWLQDFKLPVVLGSSDAQKVTQPDGSLKRIDFNSVIMYEGAQTQGVYHKLRLVPFTEHFPYGGILQWMKDILESLDTPTWTAGYELQLLQYGDLLLGTPICFEDSFGYISRDMVNAGARLLVNLTNDSWSKSVPAAMQHLAMATVRSIETKTAMVRSTNGGMSALIDPNGIILKLNEPFTESFMVVDAPIMENPSTPYLAYGDLWGVIALAGSGLLMVFTVVVLVRRKRHKDRANNAADNS